MHRSNPMVAQMALVKLNQSQSKTKRHELGKGIGRRGWGGQETKGIGRVTRIYTGTKRLKS